MEKDENTKCMWSESFLMQRIKSSLHSLKLWFWDCPSESDGAISWLVMTYPSMVITSFALLLSKWHEKSGKIIQLSTVTFDNMLPCCQYDSGIWFREVYQKFFHSKMPKSEYSICFFYWLIVKDNNVKANKKRANACFPQKVVLKF